VPAGHRNNNGSQFYNRGLNVNYWSSSVGSSSNAWNRNLNYDNAQAARWLNNRSNGVSVRCVRESKRHNCSAMNRAPLMERIFLFLFRIFVENPFFSVCAYYRPESEMVMAMPSVPLESGNPPNAFWERCGGV
jgi:hypothetical protein